MLDIDAIRERLISRYDDLGLSKTGIWHKEHGIGQTTIRNFLDSSTNSLTLDTILKLQKPLKTTAEWLIFGAGSATISEDSLRAMVDNALSEMQPGMTIAEIRPLVASNLHGQLERVLSGQVESDHEGKENGHGTAVRSAAPTTTAGQAV